MQGTRQDWKETHQTVDRRDLRSVGAGVIFVFCSVFVFSQFRTFSGRKVFYLVLVKNKQHSYTDGGNSIWSIPYEGQHFNIYQSCKCICP